MSSVEPDAAEQAGSEETVAETPGAGPDERYRDVLEVLTTELGDALVETYELRGDLWIRVHRDAWKRAAEVLRHQLGFDYFSYLSGIDWMPHTWPNPKVVEGEGAEEPEPEPQPAGITSGYAGGETRFQVLARVYSIRRHTGVTLKADLDDGAPTVETWTGVYAGADWHERETWEMYGFEFTGHPNLVHLYLPSEFEGFPLRKDFPLLSREVKPWPGLVDVEGFPAGYGDDEAAAAATPAGDAAAGEGEAAAGEGEAAAGGGEAG